MSRPALEVADIFRDLGSAWRSANAGHVSLDQLKVMTAIERCRTAALGGHVARCEKCSHTVIAYNSCRNRHCPKCQGAAAKQWLAEREAELLPVPYFHVVFTLPAPVVDIAYQNKAVVYDLLFKAAADTILTIAADPKHLGASIGITAVLHTWGSAMTHHPHVHMIVPGGGLSLDGKKWRACRPGFFLPVRVLSRLFRRLSLKKLKAAHAAGRLCFYGEHSPLAEREAFTAYLRPLRKIEWVVYAKRPSAVLRPCSLICRVTPTASPSPTPPDRARRQHRQLSLQGLSERRPRSLQGNDARDRRVHSPLSHARAAERLPPHPPLRPVRQAALAPTTSPAPANCSVPKSQDQPADTDDPVATSRPPLSLPCPCCGGRMIIIEIFERGATPGHRPTAPISVIKIDTS